LALHDAVVSAELQTPIALPSSTLSPQVKAWRITADALPA
jgi:hypothetical protein